MKICVAMCTYNGARYLREQLISIAEQTRLPEELVLCDDGSSDETREIIETFAASSPFPVRLHTNEKTLGPTKNFEKAISLCEGEVIALADQDDVWHPEKLMRMDAAFSASPHLGLVFTDLEIVDEKLRPLGYRASQCEWVEFDEKGQRLFKRGLASDLLLTRNVVTGCAMAFRSKFKDLIMPIPETDQWLVHDYWIASIITAVADVGFIDAPLVKYRCHPEQQVGLMHPPEPDAGNRVRAWRRMESYPVKWKLLATINERLSSEGNAAKYGKIASELDNRMAHARVRADLHSRTFLNRLACVLEELFMLNYYRFPNPDSNGFYDLAYDVVKTLVPFRFQMRNSNF